MKLEMAIRERWFIISIGNVYKFYWDIFIICLAIYNALALPLQIAFVAEVKKFYDDSTFLQVLENTIDIFFLFDI